MTTDHTPDTGQPDGSAADGAAAYSAMVQVQDNGVVIFSRCDYLYRSGERNESTYEQWGHLDGDIIARIDPTATKDIAHAAVIAAALSETMKRNTTLQAEVERLKGEVKARDAAIKRRDETQRILSTTVVALRAELAEVRKCSVCLGTGDPGNGKPCICNGTGSAIEEMSGLRGMIYDAQVEIDRKDAELAEVRAELSMVQDELTTAQQVIVEHCQPWQSIDEHGDFERYVCPACDGKWGDNGLDHDEDCAFIAALRAQHDRIERQHAERGTQAAGEV